MTDKYADWSLENLKEGAREAYQGWQEALEAGADTDVIYLLSGRAMELSHARAVRERDLRYYGYPGYTEAKEAQEDEVKAWGDRLRKAEARVAELEERLRWIPVDERLPDKGISVLFVPVGFLKPLVGTYVGNHKWETRPVRVGYNAVAYWQPIEEPPMTQE